MWYKLAEVNGLTAESALIEGQALLIPVGVVRNTNNASTFQPYDPLEVLGETAPTTPVTPKPKKQKCGGFGAILLAVIAAVVTYFSFGATTAFFGTTLGWGATATAIAAGATAAAAGSIVSQAVGVATGIQDKFSWNAVALAAIGGGVGGGLNPTGAAAASWQEAALNGVTANVITQGIGVATGLQKEFSWASVAVAGIAAGVGHVVSKNLPNSAHTETRIGADGVAHQVHVPASFSNTLVSGMAGGIAGAAARSLVEGTDFGDNVMAALPDILGNVVGNAIAGGISKQMEKAHNDREAKHAQEARTAEEQEAQRLRLTYEAYQAAYGNGDAEGMLMPIRDGDWPTMPGIQNALDELRRAMGGNGLEGDRPASNEFEVIPRITSDDQFSQSDEIISYTYEHAATMRETALLLDIPPSAIATNIGEEGRTHRGLRGFLKDDVLDWWSSQNVDNLDHRGILRLYEQRRSVIESGGVIQGRGLERGLVLVDPIRVDAGLGNVNFGTAIYMLRGYLESTPSGQDPLRLRQYADRYDNLWRDLNDPRSAALVRIVGLQVRATQDFYLNGTGVGNAPARDLLRSTYEASSGTLRDQLLNAGYRTSRNYIVSQAREGQVGPILRGDNWYNYFTDPRSPYHHTRHMLGD